MSLRSTGAPEHGVHLGILLIKMLYGQVVYTTSPGYLGRLYSTGILLRTRERGP